MVRRASIVSYAVYVVKKDGVLCDKEIVGEFIHSDAAKERKLALQKEFPNNSYCYRQRTRVRPILKEV